MALSVPHEIPRFLPVCSLNRRGLDCKFLQFSPGHPRPSLMARAQSGRAMKRRERKQGPDLEQEGRWIPCYKLR